MLVSVAAPSTMLLKLWTYKIAMGRRHLSGQEYLGVFGLGDLPRSER
jgi:hypothetical protein